MDHVHYNLALHFMESEPVAVARHLELANPEHAAELIKAAPVSVAIKVLKSMSASVSAKLFQYFTAEQSLKLIEDMEVTDLSAILRHVDISTRQSTVKLLPIRKQALCNMLITYPEYSIGSMLETDVLVVDSQMSVKEVLLRIKKRTYSYLQWLYVVNQTRQLEGKVFIGDLFSADPHAPITTLISAYDSAVSASADMVSAIDWDVWNHTDTLAVVNKKQEFMGVIHFNRLRHFMAVKRTQEGRADSVSSDLLEIYGDTIVSMLDLIQPLEGKS